jgi:hypothetical protein
MHCSVVAEMVVFASGTRSWKISANSSQKSWSPLAKVKWILCPESLLRWWDLYLVSLHHFTWMNNRIQAGSQLLNYVHFEVLFCWHNWQCFVTDEAVWYVFVSKPEWIVCWVLNQNERKESVSSEIINDYNGFSYYLDCLIRNNAKSQEF